MMGRGLPPLSALARELMAKERLRPSEDEALKRRVLERARDALSPDRPSGVALRPAHTSAWPQARRAPRAALLIAAALAVASLAAASVGIYRWSASPTESAATPKDVGFAMAPPVAPRAHRVAAPSEVPAAAPEANPPPGPASAAHADAQSAASASMQQYAVELELLEPARRSISRGNYAEALAAIARHQQEFPRGQLSEEREALRVRALWGMGQKADAEATAAKFRNRYPKSGLLGWMPEPAKHAP